MKARKKPVIINCVKYLGDTSITEKSPSWITKAYEKGIIYRDPIKQRDFYIKTLEGNMLISPGDIIIEGIEGEIYPCKPDIFEKTYEILEDD